VYGPQENAEIEERENFYENLSLEIEKTLHADEGLMLVGDFNAKISLCDNKIISESGNSEMLRQVISKYDLNVMNFADECTSKWTWSRNVEGISQKSTIDYLITDCKTTRKKITEMDIDEEKIVCPFHQKESKGSEKLIYSDHKPITAKLSISHSKVSPEKVKKELGSFPKRY